MAPCASHKRMAASPDDGETVPRACDSIDRGSFVSEKVSVRGQVPPDWRHSTCTQRTPWMGIYRRSPPSEPPAPAAADDVGGVLAERLRAIAASETPEDVLQPALQAIVEAIGVQAGAI